MLDLNGKAKHKTISKITPKHHKKHMNGITATNIGSST